MSLDQILNRGLEAYTVFTDNHAAASAPAAPVVAAAPMADRKWLLLAIAGAVVLVLALIFRPRKGK